MGYKKIGIFPCTIPELVGIEIKGENDKAFSNFLLHGD